MRERWNWLVIYREVGREGNVKNIICDLRKIYKKLCGKIKSG